MKYFIFGPGEWYNGSMGSSRIIYHYVPHRNRQTDIYPLLWLICYCVVIVDH